MGTEIVMEALERTNLKVLKPSRKPVRAGDVFVCQPDDSRFLFGRVIRTDVNVGGFPNGILVYIYNASSSKKGSVPKLDRDDLLLPPLATNRLPWSRGYFETVTTRPLTDADVLPVHCFRSSSGRCYDEMGNLMEAPVAPVGDFALQSFRSIDDLISDALGIPKAP